MALDPRAHPLVDHLGVWVQETVVVKTVDNETHHGTLTKFGNGTLTLWAVLSKQNEESRSGELIVVLDKIITICAPYTDS